VRIEHLFRIVDGLYHIMGQVKEVSFAHLNLYLEYPSRHVCEGDARNRRWCSV
jgi:hypothetical protein